MSPYHAKRNVKRARRVSYSQPSSFSKASKRTGPKLSQLTLRERQLVEDLKESEAKYRSMADSFDGMIYICSKDYKVEFANIWMKKRIGYDPVGKACYRVLHNRSSVCPWCPNKNVFKGETVRQDLKNPKDGRWYHTVNTPIYHSDGSVSKMATITDITDRKRAEGSLQTEKEKFKAIFDQTQQLIGLLRKDGTLLEANLVALDYVGAKASDVLNKPFWKTLWWRHSKQVRARLRKAIKIAARGKFVRYETSHVARDGSIRFVDFSIRPVRDKQGRVLFLIPEGWDITERKLVEKSLLESEAMFRTLTERSPNMIFINQGGRIVYVNPKCTEIMGYSLKEFYAPRFNFLKLIHPDDISKARRNFRAHQAGREVSPCEYKMITRRGEVIHSILTTKLIEYHGNSAILGIVTDITEQKKAESLLVKREAYFSAIVENQPGMVWLKDTDGRFLAVNQKFVNACRLKISKNVIGKTDFDVWAKELAEKYTTDDKKIMKTGRANVVEELISDGGVRKWYETFKTPVRNEEGKILGTSGCAQDITERKRIEEKIRESERLHASLIQSLPGFVYRCRNDRTWTMQYISKGCFAVTGYRPEELVNNRRLSYNDLILPEYQKFLWKKWQRLLVRRENLEEEYPIRTAEGDIRWVWERGQGVFDEKGKLLFLEGYIEDVTEQRRAEEELKRSISLRRATLESTADGILVVDQSGSAEDYNERFRRLWRIPKKILETRDDKKLLRSVLAQLKHPRKFLARVQWYYKHPQKSGFDVIEFKDGRVFERATHPQRVDKKSVGRVWSFRDITGRKKAEAALRLAYFSVNHAEDSIFQVDSQGNFLFVNDAACRNLGYSRKKLLSMKVFEADSNFQRSTWRAHWNNLRRRKYLRMEIVHKARDGRSIPAEIGIDYLKFEGGEYHFAFARDISARKQAEEALRESHRELREIIDTVPHLICAKDAEGRFLIANRAIAELYGMRHEDLLGRKQRDLHPVRSEAENFLREDIDVIRTGAPRFFAARSFTDIENCEHFLQTFKIPFKVAGVEAPAVLVVAVDVTEHKKVEDFRNEIVRTLSHELRTPLSIEKGGISLLLDGSAGTITEEQKLLLETVMRNIDRLSRMIDKLLDVSRIESGKWKMVFKEVDLRDIVRETIAEFEHMDRKPEIALTAVYANEEAKACADKDGIAQVLINLIGNALKFTPKGVVEVSVSVLREEVSCSVKDTGVGISPENMAKMFEKFQQFSWPGGAGREGVGLGLAIAKGIIEMHRGRIWAKSVPGKGTTVTFVLPRFYGKGA